MLISDWSIARPAWSVRWRLIELLRWSLTELLRWSLTELLSWRLTELLRWYWLVAWLGGIGAYEDQRTITISNNNYFYADFY